MVFDLAFGLQSQIQGYRMMYQISCRNCVRTRAEIISNDARPLWAAYTFMTFDLAFDLQVQIEGQMTKYLLDIVPKLYQLDYQNDLKRRQASLDTIIFDMIFDL